MVTGHLRRRDKERSNPSGNICSRKWEAQKELCRARLKPADIDFVFCNHLHADHIGGNTRLVNGKWVPDVSQRALPVRRIRQYGACQTRLGERRPPDHDGPRLRTQRGPIVHGRRAVFVDGRLRLRSRLSTGADAGTQHPARGAWDRRWQESGFVCGDLMHHPVQGERPPVRAAVMLDPKQSDLATSQGFLAQHCDTGTLVVPPQFRPRHVRPAVRHLAKAGFDSISWRGRRDNEHEGAKLTVPTRSALLSAQPAFAMKAVRAAPRTRNGRSRASAGRRRLVARLRPGGGEGRSRLGWTVGVMRNLVGRACAR